MTVDQHAPIILMAPDEAHSLVAGALLKQEGSTLWVRVEEWSEMLLPGQLVLAMMQSSNAPLYAHAEVKAIQVDCVAVELMVPFRATANRRGEPRYPSLLTAAINSEAGEWLPVRVLDISRGGAAIELPSWEEEGGFELWLPWEGDSLPFHCAVAGREESWNSVILHCAFSEPPAEVRAALDDLLAQLRHSFDRAQDFLAQRIDDLPHSKPHPRRRAVA